MLRIISLLLLLLPLCGQSQSSLTENTLQLDEGTIGSAAGIEDMAWLTGRWTGSGLGGWIEETWNPPVGGNMVGSFRFLQGDKTIFYELCVIEPLGESLVLKVKHFNADFSAWEEKADYASFPLIKKEEGKVWFDGMTMEYGPNEVIIYLAISHQDGEPTEEVFRYYRTPIEPPATEPKTQLMLLGSYHMSNPGMDQFNLESDDVLAPQRQKEIEEVVALLAEFKPTKIAIESPYQDSLALARYAAYLEDNLELRRSEEEQIGFRLAKYLGHETIYPIDVRMNLDQPGLEGVIASDPAKFGPHMAKLEQTGQGVIQMMGEWLSAGTIREMLYNMNRPEFVDMAYQLYLQFFLPLVVEDNYAGADLIAVWNQRNLRIMSHLHMIDCSPEDRVLIIYGQGHVPLFERIAEDSPFFEVVDVLPYLRAKE